MERKRSYDEEYDHKKNKKQKVIYAEGENDKYQQSLVHDVEKTKLAIAIEGFITRFPQLKQFIPREYQDSVIVYLNGMDTLELNKLLNTCRLIVSNSNSNRANLGQMDFILGVCEQFPSLNLEGARKVIESNPLVRDTLSEIQLENKIPEYVDPWQRLAITVGSLLVGLRARNAADKANSAEFQKKVAENITLLETATIDE